MEKKIMVSGSPKLLCNNETDWVSNRKWLINTLNVAVQDIESCIMQLLLTLCVNWKDLRPREQCDTLWWCNSSRDDSNDAPEAPACSTPKNRDASIVWTWLFQSDRLWPVTGGSGTEKSDFLSASASTLNAETPCCTCPRLGRYKKGRACKNGSKQRTASVLALLL